MQLPQWILQVSVACGNSGCRSQGEDDEEHSHILEGQNIANHQVQPWSTRLHPYPCLIQKMKTYLELECKLCPKHRPQQTQP